MRNRRLRRGLNLALLVWLCLLGPAQAAESGFSGVIQMIVDLVARLTEPPVRLPAKQEYAAPKPLSEQGEFNEVWTSVTAEQVADLLRAEGFKDFEIDKDGDIVVRMAGYKVLLLIGTNQNSWLLFKFALSSRQMRLTTLNEWNQKVKYSRAYLSPNGEVILESDQDLAGGVTPERLKAFIRSYALVLEEFIKFLRRRAGG